MHLCYFYRHPIPFFSLSLYPAFADTLLIQFLQHQHSDPRIIAGDDPLHLGFVPVPVVDHGAKTRAPIIPMN